MKHLSHVIYAEPRRAIKANGAGSAMDAGSYLDLIRLVNGGKKVRKKMNRDSKDINSGGALYAGDLSGLSGIWIYRDGNWLSLHPNRVFKEKGHYYRRWLNRNIMTYYLPIFIFGLGYYLFKLICSPCHDRN
jgi:hypothetical protein